jgi:hypothetical protein
LRHTDALGLGDQFIRIVSTIVRIERSPLIAASIALASSCDQCDTGHVSSSSTSKHATIAPSRRQGPMAVRSAPRVGLLRADSLH